MRIHLSEFFFKNIQHGHLYSLFINRFNNWAEQMLISWHLGHECQNFYTSLLARPDHALSTSLLTVYRQWYKRGLTTYTYNSGHMKMESNRLPEWLGLSTIWICMYCTLIYKTTSYGNHNIKWHVWYTGKAIISDVNVKCKIPVLVNLKVWKILKWSFMELMLKE